MVEAVPVPEGMDKPILYTIHMFQAEPAQNEQAYAEQENIEHDKALLSSWARIF